MNKLLTSITSLAFLALIPASALNFMIVTDEADPTTTEAFYTFLNSTYAGSTFSTGQFTDHTATATTNAIAAADIIIVTRNTNSGNYATSDAEVTFWNETVSKPIILATDFIARNSPVRWGWGSSTVGVNGGDTLVTAAGASFFGVSAGSNNFFTEGQITLNSANTFGEGTILATNTSGAAQSVYWAAGEEAANGDIFGGERLFFGAGGVQPVTNQHSFTLTASGTTALTNAINTLIPEPAAWSLLAGLAALGIVGSRRRGATRN